LAPELVAGSEEEFDPEAKTATSETRFTQSMQRILQLPKELVAEWAMAGRAWEKALDWA
jgi:hypothetical protein